MDKSNIKLIKTWDELKQAESDTHYLKIDKYNGWIRPKVKNEETYYDDNHYLSTHTFYGLNYTHSTRILQQCGFNVQLENWDGETEWFDMDEYLESERANKLNEKFTEFESFKEFDEQKHVYDVLNKLANVRYTKPVFHKCKSCGFLVVDYQLDKNGVCTDCRKVDK